MGLVEKKLDNATKDGEDRFDKTQRKVDELQMLLKKKEKYINILAISYKSWHFMGAIALILESFSAFNK